MRREVIPADGVATLADMLRWRGGTQPDRLAYTFLEDGEDRSSGITYAALDAEARRIAARLRAAGAVGERVLLAYPPGLDYIAAFFGCLYAGAVAVPVYPPDPTRLSRTAPRLTAIIDDARPVAALTTTAIGLIASAAIGTLPWIATDAPDGAAADDEPFGAVAPEALALLQYTSGSTGDPKGVMVTHGNLLHNVGLITTLFGLSPASRGGGWLPPYHDMGLVGLLLTPLYAGFPCWLMSPIAFLERPLRWLRLISSVGVTCAPAPNFAYELCVRKTTPDERNALDLSSLEVVPCGAEPVRADTLHRFATAFAPCGFRPEAFFPCYGLAEATLIATGGSASAAPIVATFARARLAANRVEPAGEGAADAWTLVGCGTTTDGQDLVIVHPTTRGRCRSGEVGEIWIAGPSVAPGYWNRPAETAAAFGARLDDGDGTPYLRTGDLGFLRDGELFVVGRIKDVLIVRGRNHHPHDIELTVESASPLLRPGCGAAFTVDRDGEERLVVVHEADTRQQADWQAVMADVRRAVAAEHQLAVEAIVLVAPRTIGKTSSGKIQRAATRATFLDGRLDVVSEWRAADIAGLPSDAAPSPTVLPLIAALAGELGIDPRAIDSRRPVTDYGLDSLRAVALTHRLEKALGVSLPPTRFFTASSIETLAREVAALALPPPTTPGDEPACADTIGEHPASAGQRALWFLDQLAPDNAAYHVTHAARIVGQLDVPALCRAFEALIARHAALRTTFGATDGAPVQRIGPDIAAGWFADDPERHGPTELAARLTAEAERPFDLARGPLLRVRVLTDADGERILYDALHHIVTDLWSLAILLQEIDALYAAERTGTRAALPSLTGCYSEYARRQAERLAAPRGAELRRYWEAVLEGDLEPLDLPTDRPRPPAQTFRGAAHRCTLSAELTRRLGEVAATAGATPFMTLLAAFQTLLHRYTGSDTVTVGTPAAGRTSGEWARVCGYFVNPVVLRADMSGNPTFAELLARTRTTVLGALDHQDYPFPVLVERLQPVRDPRHSPLFQVMFSLLHAPPVGKEGLLPFAVGASDARMRLGALVLDGMAAEPRAAQVDLALTLAEANGQLTAAWRYNTDLFDADTIARMAEHFHRLLEAVLADPTQRIGTVPFLTPVERQQALIVWNATATSTGPEACVHELFSAQAARAPGAVALVCGEEQLTYAELDDRANRLAHRLRTLGVGPEVLVGLCADRSLDMVVGVLGILKAGGAYLPLDPAYPKQRLALMLADAGASMLVTQEHLRDRLPASQCWVVSLDGDAESDTPATAPGGPSVDGADTLAYLIYTSGSTGAPKGVEITHRALANCLASMRERPGITAGDTLLAVTTLCFDIAALEILLPLLVGARVVIASRHVAADGAELATLLDRSGATVMQATPTTWRLLLAAGWRGRPGLTALCGGEALERDFAEERLTRVGSLWNLYGPTETTIWSAVHEVGPGTGPVAIGRPIANTEIYVLDAHLQPVPAGVPGDLYIGGLGLARGYHRRPDLTAERFIPHPYADAPGARVYRTGDRARYGPDGLVEFLGRTDRQVKVRGFRVELGEIETALRQHAAVREAIVDLQADGHDDPRLVAYLTTHGGGAPPLRELRAFLATSLPPHLIPSSFVCLDRLPTTPNGKVDRRALPQRAMREVPQAGDGASPRTPVERLLVRVWSRVLGVPDVSIHDNFFDLGGDSLVSVRLAAELSAALDVELPVKFIFLYPTIAASTAAIGTLPPRRPILTLRRPTRLDQASPFLTMEDRPLLSLFAAGKLAPVEAAAIAYLPDALLTQAGLDANAVIHDWCHDLPVFTAVDETAMGRIATIVVPRFAGQLYTDREDLLDVLIEALELAGRLGASAVSLTGLLPSATDYGHDVARAASERALPRVTTGHATTTATVVLSIRRTLEEAGRDLEDEHVAFLGLGSIGSTTLRLMVSCLRHPASITLCEAYGKVDILHAARAELAGLGYCGQVRTVRSNGRLPNELYDATLIVGATNAPNLLDLDRIRPGTLIVDDSAPHCFTADHAFERFERDRDLVFTEGGVLHAALPIRRVQYLPRAVLQTVDTRRILGSRDPHHITGCVLSSLLVTCDDTLAPTIGRVDLETARRHYEALGRLGFRAATPHCEGCTLPRSYIAAFRARFGRGRAVALGARRPVDVGGLR